MPMRRGPIAFQAYSFPTTVSWHNRKYPQSEQRKRRRIPAFGRFTIRKISCRMSATPQQLYGSERAVLLTNDDGVHPDKALILRLAQRLITEGINVVVVAPGKDNSACSQRITITHPLTLQRHLPYEEQYGKSAEPHLETPKGTLKVFSVDEGTPSDCVIIAIEAHTGLLARLGMYPCMVLSGVNYGPNLGTDVLYSGTFAGARQGAMYGIPALSSSLNMHTIDPKNELHTSSCDAAIASTVQVVRTVLSNLPEFPPDMGRRNTSRGISPVSIARDETKAVDERVRDALASGDVVLNLNVPEEWNGALEMTRLDSVLYRGVVRLDYVPNGMKGDAQESISTTLGSADTEEMHSKDSDVAAIKRGYASISAVSTWPVPHVLALPHQFFEETIRHGVEWLSKS